MRRRGSTDRTSPGPRRGWPRSGSRGVRAPEPGRDGNRADTRDNRSPSSPGRAAARQCRRGGAADDRLHPGAMGSRRRRRVSGSSASRTGGAASGTSKRTDITRRASRTRREARSSGADASGETTVTRDSDPLDETPAASGLRPVARSTASSNAPASPARSSGERRPRKVTKPLARKNAASSSVGLWAAERAHGRSPAACPRMNSATDDSSQNAVPAAAAKHSASPPPIAHGARPMAVATRYMVCRSPPASLSRLA